MFLKLTFGLELAVLTMSGLYDTIAPAVPFYVFEPPVGIPLNEFLVDPRIGDLLAYLSCAYYYSKYCESCC